MRSRDLHVRRTRVALVNGGYLNDGRHDTILSFALKQNCRYMWTLKQSLENNNKSAFVSFYRCNASVVIFNYKTNVGTSQFFENRNILHSPMLPNILR